MISISLTDFVDFVAASGTPKLTKVREIKYRAKYEPLTDYWRILRNGIVEYHALENKDKEFFDRLLAGMKNGAKREGYRPLVANYKGYLGRKEIVSTPPSKKIVWTHNELEVRVNPELCLTVKQKTSLIKLYFKAAKLSKSRVGIILLLMKLALPKPTEAVEYCLNDVNHNRPYSSANPSDDLLPLLYGEADSFVTIWKHI